MKVSFTSRIVQISVLLTVLLFIVPLAVQACSCLNPGAPCQSFWKVESVFSGQVEEITTASYQEQQSYKGNSPFERRSVRIKISEAFRGITGDSVEIKTGLNSGDCGYPFKVGESYLIYAYKDSETGELKTSICSRTQPLEKAVEDLAYIKNLAVAPSGSTLYGVIAQQFAYRSDLPYKAPVPLAGIPVIIEGQSGKITTVTDEKGEYRLADLPFGEYQISAKAPDKMLSYEKTQKVKVYDKGCMASYFRMQIKTSFSGRLLNENSEPAVDISVNLVPVEQINDPRYYSSQSNSTDKEGNFIIGSIPDGRYYLQAFISRYGNGALIYPKTFYPGTKNLAEAKIIDIKEGQILENFDFKLSPKYNLRKIEGTVVFPDGTSAVNASISFEGTEKSYIYGYPNAFYTKADGTFSFELADGIKYLLKSYISTNGEQRHAEPIEIPANGNINNIKFVISEPNGSCSKCRNQKILN